MMTVHPAVVESVIKLNIQQHSHGVLVMLGIYLAVMQ